MDFITGSDRQQTHFLPPTLEDYIGADNPVRFLDAFVGKLDLQAAGFLFPKSNPQGRGRPGYHPADLLKLYLYGYFNQIRSSRRLETECHRNLEVLWLLRELKPDFKTIADFRKDNAKAFKEVVRQFTRLCRQLGLFGGQLLAIDGTKLKASNAPDRNWSQRKLDQQMAKVDARLEEYLHALDAADAQPEPGFAPVKVEELKARVARLEEHKAQIEQRLQSLAQTGETQLSTTDPDSRSMKSKQGHVVGYNVQGSADAKHHLLVTVQATNAVVDQGQLATVAQAAKQELQITQADVVADGGYFKSEDIKSCQEMGLEPHLPAVNNSPSERAGLYGKSDFQYDAARNLYRCPAGAQLRFRRQTEDKGRKLFNYDNPHACTACALKRRCTKSAHRTVTRWEHEASVERMNAAVAAHPGKLALRKTLIEHPWATIKMILAGGFVVRGLEKVRAEVNLAHFSYNLRRALAVVGLEKLLKALEQFQPGPPTSVGGNHLKSVRKTSPMGVWGRIASGYRRRTTLLQDCVRNFLAACPCG